MQQYQTRRAGDLEIAFRIIGEGPPLIMFHGAEGDHAVFDQLQDALSDSFTAISFDQRDCGRTRYESGKPYTLKEVAHDAILLMDALAYRTANVIGSSMGGILAQLMAFNWPERVERLVLGMTWSADERLQDLNPEGLARRAEYAAMGEAGARLLAELMSSPKNVAANPTILAAMSGMRSEVTPEARERRQAAFQAPFDFDPAGIRSKTLVIGGGVDQLVPPSLAQRLAARIPGARYELMPEAGHVAAIESPDAMASLVRGFLKA